MIWFISDNGPATRGGGPGLAKGGRQQGETDFPAVTSDYFPTILDLLDILLDNQPMLEGIGIRDVNESDSVRIRNKPIGFQSAYKKTFMTALFDNRYKLVSKDNSITF